MTAKLLREFVQLLVERDNDAVTLRLANNSFIAISRLFNKLQGKKPSVFARVVGKDDTGRYSWVNLGAALPRQEHQGMYLFIHDKKLSGVKDTLTASAQKLGASPNREYRINVFFNVPGDTVAEFNKNFRETIATQFEAARVHYIHEFVHVLDFRRMSDDYINSRIETRKARREKGERKDFNAYMNDPMETNAFLHESFAKLMIKLRRVWSLEEFESLMGANPKAFIELFMSKYLDPRARRHWNEDNVRKAVKRAVQFYNRAREKFELAL